jgi:hypothetical protein
MRHHLTKSDEKKGGHDSHEHMDHHDHMKKAMEHLKHAHKKAPKHDTMAHDKSMDRKNLSKARKAK